MKCLIDTMLGSTSCPALHMVCRLVYTFAGKAPKIISSGSSRQLLREHGLLERFRRSINLESNRMVG